MLIVLIVIVFSYMGFTINISSLLIWICSSAAADYGSFHCRLFLN